MTRIVRVGKVAETDRAGRAGFDAGGHVVGWIDFALARSGRLFFRRVQARVAQIALLHDAAHADGNAGVQALFHALRATPDPTS